MVLRIFSLISISQRKRVARKSSAEKLLFKFHRFHVSILKIEHDLTVFLTFFFFLNKSQVGIADFVCSKIREISCEGTLTAWEPVKLDYTLQDTLHVPAE